MAEKLYDRLTAEGIKVFYSNKAIIEQGVGDYNRFINGALDKCSILVAVGSSIENFESQWVQYEYVSFYDDILSKRKDSRYCTVCSFISQVKPSDLPRPLRNLQVFEDEDLVVEFVQNNLKKRDEILAKENPKKLEAVNPEVIEKQDTQNNDVAVIDKKEIRNENKKEKPLSKNNKPEKKKGKKGKKIFSIIISCILALNLLLFIIPIVNTIKIGVERDGSTEYVKANRDDYYIKIGNAVITTDTIEDLSKMKKLQNVDFENCTLADGVCEQFATLEKLTELNMINVEGVTDLSFTSQSTNLYKLSLKNCGITDEIAETIDMTAIAQLAITDTTSLTNIDFVKDARLFQRLDISNTKVSDLSPLENNANLLSITFDNCEVSDISPLASCRDLQIINGGDNNISNIDSLATLEDIKILKLNNNNIIAIKDDFKSLRMESIDFSENPLMDVSGFSNLTTLKGINFNNTNFANNSDINMFDFLGKSSGTLIDCYLSYSSIPSTVLNHLSKATHLETLHIDGIQTENLDFLIECINITDLSAAGCKINSVEALSSLPKLENLCLRDNQISDISALFYVDREGSTINMDLSNNSITTIYAEFPEKVKFGTLILNGNENFDYSVLSLYTGNNLGITYYDVIQIENLKNFNNVYVENVPDDKIVMYEDSLGYRFNQGVINLAGELVSE